MGITERILYKSERNPALEPAAWRVTDPRQLSGEAAGTARLDPRRLGEAPALTEKQRAALAAGRSRAVKRRDTPRLRKGLSQWTKALRAGGVRRVAVAAAYVVYCGVLDICAAARRKG